MKPINLWKGLHAVIVLNILFILSFIGWLSSCNEPFQGLNIVHIILAPLLLLLINLSFFTKSWRLKSKNDFLKSNGILKRAKVVEVINETYGIERPFFNKEEKQGWLLIMELLEEPSLRLKSEIYSDDLTTMMGKELNLYVHPSQPSQFLLIL